eukprot:scaffold54878_cov67-Phaeocystis_antarctica.AAC.6
MSPLRVCATEPSTKLTSSSRASAPARASDMRAGRSLSRSTPVYAAFRRAVLVYVLHASAMVEPREGGVSEHVGGVGAHHLEELLGVDAPVGIATHEHRVGADLGRLPEEQCICNA